MSRISEGTILTAPKGKGFHIYRGTVGFKTSKGVSTQYKIGKGLKPMRRESWTTSYDIAKTFATEISEHYGGIEAGYVPIVYHALCRRIEKPKYYDFEKEVFPLRGKSKVIKVDILGDEKQLFKREKTKKIKLPKGVTYV